MTQRATRLLRMLEELRQRRGAVRGAQLAECLGVSLRTVYRDIEALRSQGAQIDGDAGVGYRLRPGFVMPPLMFPAEELEALVLGARWVASHCDPELAAAANRALSRIAGVLPGERRLEIETSGLFAPYWQQRAPEPWVPALRRAIRDGHAVRLRYRDAEGRESERVVWPFAMAFLDDMRLIAAWCEQRGDFRHFRADRVLDLEDTGRRYPQTRHQLLRRWEQLRLRRSEG
ncbi:MULTISPECIES: helix-turn-helix transcriptional regulator [Pseudoxanthomonas]|uniref:Putative DNA-binding transcriptional regulator YafY n=1 Tax=Pseudoxanthomonas taiwanensis J19 TaxID=935569 RepID=A0A562DIS3_9GAMM|nr:MULTISPECIES: YafY family protein [Pseudoxanthomonas]RRN80504.1 YafY family transcriptional regulator [Pseudoxanthomonas sp. SGD-10]TWH09496.1 putative DNA-binding transcriptional regulator YafY [Pseudoxanthomonas taiwanensis J19]